MYLVEFVDCYRLLSIFVNLWVPKVVPAQNDADGGDDEPTSAMPTGTGKQTRTGTKYPVQRIPPHSDNGDVQ